MGGCKCASCTKGVVQQGGCVNGVSPYSHHQVELYELDVEGAKIGEPKKTTVTIADDDEFQEILDNMMKLTNENLAGPQDHDHDL